MSKKHELNQTREEMFVLVSQVRSLLRKGRIQLLVIMILCATLGNPIRFNCEDFRSLETSH